MSWVRGPAAPRGWPARLSLGLWLLALTAAALVIARTHFTADLSAFLPAKPDARQQVLIDQLQSGAVARTLFVGIEGGDAKQRAAASQQLAAHLRASGRFEQVSNGARGDGPKTAEGGSVGGEWQAAGEWVFKHRYHLSPAVNAERFTVAGLREGIDDSLSLLGTPAGRALKPLLERDPTGETQRIVETLLPSSGPRSEEGVWAGRALPGHSPRAVLLLSTRAAGSDIDGQLAAIEAVRQGFAALSLPGLSLQISGAGVFAVESRAKIEREVQQLAIAGTLAVSLLLWVAFASLPALLVAALPVVSGVLCGIATVSLVFGSVHGMTLGFGSTLIGEAVDYAIYFLIQARGAGGPGSVAPSTGAGWLRWRQDNWPTVRLGLWTSVCGFAVLMFSGFTGLAQLGVFSTAGLVGAVLTTRFVLPVLMPDGAVGEGLRKPLGRATEGVMHGMRKLRPAWLALGVAAVLLLAWRGGDAWNANLSSLSPVSRAAIELDEGLRADLTAGEARTLVVAGGGDLQAALVAAEAAAVRLDVLVAEGVLAGYDSPARLLPSAATQQARLASLPPADLLRTRVAEATEGGPLKAERLAAFIDEVQAARQLAPVQMADVAGTAIEPLLKALLVERSAAAGGGWSALISLHAGTAPLEGANAARVAQALADQTDVQVIDIGRELRGLYERYLREALAQSLLGAVAVLVVLGWHLRSPARLLAVAQPLVLAVVLTLAGLVALEVELGILHVVGLLLVVAVGSNYALFFDHWRLADQADAAASRDMLASLALANLTTVVSFGLIALSDIPALSAIGRVVAPGALLALLLSAAFARGPSAGPARGRAPPARGV